VTSINHPAKHPPNYLQNRVSSATLSIVLAHTGIIRSLFLFLYNNNIPIKYVNNMLYLSITTQIPLLTYISISSFKCMICYDRLVDFLRVICISVSRIRLKSTAFKLLIYRLYFISINFFFSHQNHACKESIFFHELEIDVT